MRRLLSPAYTQERRRAYSWDDGRENNYNVPYAVFDVGSGYSWTTGRHYLSELQINVKNALNRHYTWGSGVPGLPFQVIASYDLKF